MPHPEKKAAGALRNVVCPPPPGFEADLQKLARATARVFPIPAQHRADLPSAVRELSRILTVGRAELARPYWAWPRLTSAYLCYFLPWNICRMSRLLPGLDLGLRPGALALDLGSGPLTLPLALWCAKPELRAVPLEFICADSAKRPLEIGADILREMTGKDCPWRVRLIHSPKGLFPPGAPDAGADLLTMLNVLNEADKKHRAQKTGAALEAVVKKARRALRPGGRMFLLEPGTRLGGKLVAMTRKEATTQGFHPLSPCTHDFPCPFLPRSETGRKEFPKPGKPPSGWCHFTCAANAVPEDLLRLGRLAGLPKENLAFSFLHLELGAPQSRQTDFSLEPRRPSGSPERTRGPSVGQDRENEKGKTSAGAGKHPALSDTAVDLRVVSGPITLPDQKQSARYACSGAGLVLLTRATRLHPGAGVRGAPARKPGKNTQDATDDKSGLPVFTPVPGA
ncbi:MAG: small ribosomal subunit Rsm22 family protein [Desulfovibrio sp.]|jgi:SAM-dependent methyltransferase|nr:small ribosomal subunit Rsm22 family protein [Desulfovibrio sp.]